MLTARGGMTSHAAVVARGMGKPCVAGCEALEIDARGARHSGSASSVVREGDMITIDGATGEVMLGALPLCRRRSTTTSGRHGLGRRDSPAAGARQRRHAEDAARARELGAEGIGLCRTEHMFFGDDRLPVVRRDDPGRRRATSGARPLERLLPMQQADFEGIFEAMDGLPVTIRLLDPPLHEFLPDLTTDARDRAAARGRGRRGELRAAGAAAGAGARRCTSRTRCSACAAAGWAADPEIYAMQVRAIVRAARRACGGRRRSRS